MKLCFATNNKNKLEEVSKLLNFPLLSLEDIGCYEEIPETADTLEGNSMLKAEHVWREYGIPCFADDTGLEIEAINNEPGVRSARYAGDEKDNLKNIDLVLKKLDGNTNRSARFRTIITLILSDDRQFQFEGEVLGTIGTELKGNDGFGYDPIFTPEGFKKTFAELDMNEKNKISHRGIAVRKLTDYIKNNLVN